MPVAMPGFFRPAASSCRLSAHVLSASSMDGGGGGGSATASSASRSMAAASFGSATLMSWVTLLSVRRFQWSRSFPTQ